MVMLGCQQIEIHPQPLFTKRQEDLAKSRSIEEFKSDMKSKQMISRICEGLKPEIL